MTLTGIEAKRRCAELENAKPGKLDDGYDCPLCLNRGYSMEVSDSGEIVSVMCSCTPKRRSLRYIRRSGLSELLNRYTLDSWKCREAWQKNLLETALRYVERPDGWMYLAGRPGTGKTHICTAVCGLLMEKGLETHYMLWRDVSVRAKALVNDCDRYDELLQPLIKSPVLYIDDFFKTGKGKEPTDADVSFAFQILNNRYNDSRKLTLISSELPLEKVLDIDEAVGSRIYQRTEGRYMNLTNYANWRLDAT